MPREPPRVSSRRSLSIQKVGDLEQVVFALDEQLVTTVGQRLQIPFGIRNHQSLIKSRVEVFQGACRKRSLRKRAGRVTGNVDTHVGTFDQLVGVNQQRLPTA